MRLLSAKLSEGELDDNSYIESGINLPVDAELKPGSVISYAPLGGGHGTFLAKFRRKLDGCIEVEIGNTIRYLNPVFIAQVTVIAPEDVPEDIDIILERLSVKESYSLFADFRKFSDTIPPEKIGIRP